MSKSNTKRDMIRKRRQRQTINRRLGIVAWVVVGAVLIGAALILAARNTAQPPSTIVPIATRTGEIPSTWTSQGDPNAPVKIDVWEDFLCVACARYTQTIEPQVIEELVKTGKVYYTFHFYPFIDAGPGGISTRTATAAACAAGQGRFWDYHDLIFANYTDESAGVYPKSQLVQFAEFLELDMTQFDDCQAENTYASRISDDLELGKAMGVSGTPSVFVDGTQLTPGYIPSYENILAAVEAAISGSQP